ncbi:MAG: hypothetical protein A2542_02010 [Parcubacteria group bacterium RIFOXYD2_FULL_52_8]|nr:MAG: hypothetical protein A2542_02010 [Parcubacteria group bacterium RIFOXYD2_FULL_52_8]
MSSAIDQLTESFARFPGIGPRQAKRFVYHLLQQDPAVLANLSQQILKLRKEINRCGRCYRFFSPTENYQEQCDFCRDTSRDAAQLMVVARDTDLDAMHKSHAYDGYYFVLGGLLSLTERHPDPSLRGVQLLARVQADVAAGSLKEIILALSANTEGDHTAEYVESLVSPLTESGQLKLSHLGRGLSTGTELEYSDSATIKSALKNRS